MKCHYIDQKIWIFSAAASFFLIFGCRGTTSGSEVADNSLQKISENKACGRLVPSVFPVAPVEAENELLPPRKMGGGVDELQLSGSSSTGYMIGKIYLTEQMYEEYLRVKKAFHTAIVPAGTGMGWIGNILRQPKCTDVHRTVLPQVEAELEKGDLIHSVFPCSVVQGKGIIEHIYLGICKKPPGTIGRLIAWTDPWDGLDEFYLPETGRHKSTDDLVVSVLNFHKSPKKSGQPAKKEFSDE